MPLNYAPVALQKGSKGKRGKTTPGAALAYEAMRYPYALSPVRSVFLPLSISFVATSWPQSRPARGRHPDQTPVKRALELYREYVLQQAVAARFRSPRSKRYDEGWEQ